jgi:hypothetical protein
MLWIQERMPQKSMLVQTLKLNHTAEVKPVRPVFITSQTGLAAILSPK